MVSGSAGTPLGAALRNPTLPCAIEVCSFGSEMPKALAIGHCSGDGLGWLDTEPGSIAVRMTLEAGEAHYSVTIRHGDRYT